MIFSSAVMLVVVADECQGKGWLFAEMRGEILILSLCITVYCTRRGNKRLFLKSGVRVAKNIELIEAAATTLQGTQRVVRLVLCMAESQP